MYSRKEVSLSFVLVLIEEPLRLYIINIRALVADDGLVHT